MTDAKAIRDGIETPTVWKGRADTPRGPSATDLRKRASGYVYTSGELHAVPADDYYRERAEKIAADAIAEQDDAA